MSSCAGFGAAQATLSKCKNGFCSEARYISALISEVGVFASGVSLSSAVFGNVLVQCDQFFSYDGRRWRGPFILDMTPK
jgi:hypothetical protein